MHSASGVGFADQQYGSLRVNSCMSEAALMTSGQTNKMIEAPGTKMPGVEGREEGVTSHFGSDVAQKPRRANRTREMNHFRGSHGSSISQTKSGEVEKKQRGKHRFRERPARPNLGGEEPFWNLRFL